MAGYGIESVVVQVIVVSKINSRAGIRRPAQQQLSEHVCREPIVVQPSSHKQETRESIIRMQRIDLIAESHAPSVYASEFTSGVAERSAQRLSRLISER